MKKICSILVLMAIIVIPVNAAKKKKVVEKDPAGAKISIGLFTGGTSIDDIFQKAVDGKFTTCQIEITSKAGLETAKKLIEAQKKYNIRITTIWCMPEPHEFNFAKGPKYTGLVPEENVEKKMKYYKKIIDFCQTAKVPAIHSHFGFIPEDPLSAEYKMFIVRMKELGNYAKERGVNIYFETGQETPITLIRAIKDAGTGNLFVNCDVANLILYGKANPTDAIRMFGPLVKDVHIKDGTYPDRNNPYQIGQEKPIPEGDVDFPAIIKVLKEEGYTGSLTIEHELKERSKDYIEKTRLYLQNLLDSIY